MPRDEAAPGGEERSESDPTANHPGPPGCAAAAQECTDEHCPEHGDLGPDQFEHGLGREAGSQTPRPWWHRALKVLGLLVVAAVVVIVVKGKLPTPAEFGRAIARANWAWVAVAAVSLGASIWAFGAQQRSLLRSFGVKVTHRRVTAITLASTAVTNTLPAGGAVAAGYSYRLYRASGAGRTTAATVMVISGVLTIGALVLLYFAWIGASTALPLVLRQQDAHPIVTGLIAVAIAVVLFMLFRRWNNTTRVRHVPNAPTPRLDRLEGRYPFWGRLARSGLMTLRKTAHLRPRDWAVALGCSSGKWLLEFFGLYACCLAVGIGNVSIGQLAAVFLGVQVVRQIPFTPGGIGLIEGALLAALIAAGAARAPAFAAILIFRVLSAWILIPVGYALMAELKRRDAKRLGTPLV